MKEVINESLKANQIQIKITGSDSLRASEANYIKYSLVYDDNKEVENHFETKEKGSK